MKLPDKLDMLVEESLAMLVTLSYKLQPFNKISLLSTASCPFQ
jgi:hypothetical protein